MIEWQENLSIGVLEVDIQHRLLFEKFNHFLEACSNGTEAEGVNRLFWFLEAYAVTHFSEEEKLMQRVGYPGYQQHRKKHLEFASEVTNFKERLLKEGAGQHLVNAIKLFISGWLLEHISHMDRAIGDYVTRAGIPAIS